MDFDDTFLAGVIVLVVGLFGLGVYAATSPSCNKETKQHQCIDGVLYKDVGDMMIDTGKRCIAK